MASEKITAIVESVKTMTVLELKELVDTICEELTGASLMEAKKLVETPNAKLKEQASKADAEDIQKKLAEVGAKVELK